MNRITHLGRPLSWQYLPHRLMIIFSLISLLVLFAVERFACRASVVQALGQGMIIFLAVFLAWAVSREFDPANEYAAFVAPPLVLVARLFGLTPSLLPILFLLLLARLINQSTGRAPTLADTLLLVLLGVLLMLDGYLAALLILSVAFLLNTRVSPKSNGDRLKALLAVVVFGGIWRIAGPIDWAIQFEDARLGFVFLCLVGFTAWITHPTRQLPILADTETHSLRPLRILFAQLIIAIFLIIHWIVGDPEATLALYPVVFSYAGIALYQIVVRFHNAFSDARSFKQ